MFKKIIISTALLCTNMAWGSQVTTDLSTEYISKVTAHLDGLDAQLQKVETAETAATTARRAARSASKNLASVQKDLDEANDNTAAYPRRINRDTNSIADKREESRSIFQNTFPEFSTPDEAIRSVNRTKNRLNEDKEIVEGQIRRKTAEISAPLDRARAAIERDRNQLRQNQTRLSNLDSQVANARTEFQNADRELKKARRLKNDPQLPRKIREAQKKFDEAKRARDERGTNCRGLRAVTRKICRRYNDAKANLRRLEAIAAPGSLRPLRQKRNRAQTNLDDLTDQRRRVASDTDSLLDALRRSESRVDDLEDELRRSTEPLRDEIADINRRIDRLASKISLAQRLETLESDISSLQRRIRRNEDRLEALPALIIKLEGDLTVAQQESEAASEKSADLAEALVIEQSVLTTERAEINSLRTEMNNSLSTVTELAPARDQAPNVDEVIMDSNAWNVLTTDLDNDWERASCRAETVKVLEQIETDEGTEEVITSASLKVVNLANPTSGFNEPVVVMTLESTTAELLDFNTVTLSASRSRVYTFDLIYSKSTSNKLFFMADLKDRKALIKFMLDKSRMKVKLANLNSEVTDQIEFSLRGSTAALNSSSSRNQSMRNACGGITVTDI